MSIALVASSRPQSLALAGGAAIAPDENEVILSVSIAPSWSVQNRQGEPWTYEEAATFLVLWRWRDRRSRTVEFASPELAYYLSHVVGSLEPEELAALVKRVTRLNLQPPQDSSMTSVPLVQSAIAAMVDSVMQHRLNLTKLAPGADQRKRTKLVT